MNRLTRRQWFTLSGVVVIALVLAFFLQDVIRETIIVPIAYLGWVFGILYQSLSQSVTWLAVVFVLALFLLRSLATTRFRLPRRKPKIPPALGQVEGLAQSLTRVRKGTYYKWQIANRLGRLARDFLILRGDRAGIKDHTPLTGRGWKPSKKVDKYLDIGLHGSFAHFPSPRFGFMPTEPTPLDVEVDEVLDFLESQIKTNST